LRDHIMLAAPDWAGIETAGAAPKPAKETGPDRLAWAGDEETPGARRKSAPGE